MGQSNNAASSAGRVLWYNEPGEINRMFNGVFEGGGAKGVAYVGALKALRKRKCWFTSVAGASAGSITATLIAAGIEADQLEAKVDEALKAVSPVQVGSPVRKWLRRFIKLSHGHGYYSNLGLREWLKGELIEQMLVLGVEPTNDPTFRELFDATDIELNVIATSLSLKTPVIFSHHDTPNCSVAAAVAASAAIPFGFSDSLLPVHLKDGTTWHQTIVDGGVWNNFPWFVYTDHNFRKLYERTPEILDLPDSILGFVLDEGRPFDDSDDKHREPQPKELLRGKHINFTEIGKVKPWEHRPSPSSGRCQHKEASQRFFVRLLLRFSRQLARVGAILGRGVSDAESKGVQPDRWPEPSTELYRDLVATLSGIFEGMSSLLAPIGILFVAISTVGMFAIVTFYGFEWWWSALPWSAPIPILGVMLFLILLVIVEMSIVAWVAASFLNGSLRRVGYGLVTTYLAGSSAPEWMRLDRRIVFIPVGGVGTTDFDMCPECRKLLIGRAEVETDLKLTSLGVAAPQGEGQSN